MNADFKSADFTNALPIQGAKASEGDSGEQTQARTVLYLDHTAKMGGGEIALLNLVCALDPQRYRPVVVLASDGPLVGKLRACGVETHVELLDASVLETRKESLGPRSLLRAGQAWACAGYAFRLARLARQLGADVIHTNSLKADLYGGAAGRIAGIPVVWHVRDSIDRHYLPGPVAAAFRALARVVPQVVVANSQSTLRMLHMPLRGATETIYSGFNVSRADGPTLIPSHTVEAGVKAPARRPQVVHDGFSPQWAHQVRPLPTPAISPDPEGPAPAPDRPIVALVGRIAEWKGQHIFIQAAAAVRLRFPEARFQVIGAALFGEDEYGESLRRLTRSLGMEDRVEFLGFREDVPALLSAAALVVHASILGEPFGQVVIEGMAAGKPVIATDGGALPEIVVPGETGLLVPMGDAPAMAEAISSLLGDPLRAAAMGAAGRARAWERFTISHAARKLEKVYDSLLAKAVRPQRARPAGPDSRPTSSSKGKLPA